MAFFRKLLKDSFETSLKSPNANATNVAAVHTSMERMSLGILVIVAGGLIVGKKIRNCKKGTPASADAFENLVESFLKKGKLFDAKLTMDRMIDMHYIPDQQLFKSVMEKMLLDGRVQLASKVMKSMLELGMVGDKDLMAEILKALLWRGQVRKALQQIEMLIENDCSPDFNRLLAYLCVEDKILAARKLLEYGFAKDCHITAVSRLRVFDALVAKSEALNAYCLMDKGVITNCGRSRHEVLIEMLEAQGYTEQAKILSNMHKILW